MIKYVLTIFFLLIPILVFAVEPATAPTNEIEALTALLAALDGGGYLVAALAVAQLLVIVLKKFDLHKLIGDKLDSIWPQAGKFASPILSLILNTAAAILGLLVAGTSWVTALTQVMMGPAFGKALNDLGSKIRDKG